MKPSLTISIVTMLFASGAAVAAPPDTADVEREGRSDTISAVAMRGAFLPLTLGASVRGQRAVALGLGGYDSARGQGTFEAAAEVGVWGPFAIRGGAVYAHATGTVRPSVGARVQGLAEARQGVDAALGVFYRPEGLTEAEGEVETIVSLGRHVGQTYLLGNLAYGQDPEGNERDGELRLAGLRQVRERAVFGLDGRLRFDLGSSAAKLALKHEATLDLAAGPTASVFVGPIALLAQAGASAVRFSGANLRFGAFGTLGAGTSF